MAARSSDWKRLPFTGGVPIPYEASFAPADFAAIRQGLIPRAMEDKWFIYFEAPYLFFHRSWTGHPVYRLKFEPTPQGARVCQALAGPEIGGMDPRQAAELLHSLISNLLLRRPCPFPPAADPAAAAVEQHVRSGTAQPAARAPKKE